MKLAPYSKYKDSGIHWLGDVPEHWNVKRLKAYVIQSDSGVSGVQGNNFSNNGTMVLRSTEQTITGRWKITSPARINLPASDITSTLLKSGDLVITKSSGSQAHIGKTSLVNDQIEQMHCCFSNLMQRLRLDKTVVPKFIWYNLNSVVGREQLVFQSTTTTGLRHLNGTMIGNCRLALPSFSEQTAIVRYLDYFDRQIRHYISVKEKLIGLLEEQKQVTIHRAVTRGLDPDVPFKPSGVEWLGDVPESWEVLPNRSLFNEINACNYPDEQMLSVTIKKGVIRQSALLEETSKKDSSNLDKSNYKLVLPGDIAYNKMRAWQGAIGVSPYRGIISPAYIAVRLRGAGNSHYFHFLFRTLSFAMEAERRSYGIASDMWSLRPEHFKMIYSCFPPLSEQTAIVEYLDKATTDIDAAIARARREIELLKEYRTRLIADVVTGKLDVRKAAARLPSEADENTEERPTH